jgi:hypothetical protein
MPAAQHIGASQVPGSGAASTAWQVPLPSQASQVPLQLVLQHTPSTQNPLAHSSAVPQGWPTASSGIQLPALQ